LEPTGVFDELERICGTSARASVELSDDHPSGLLSANPVKERIEARTRKNASRLVQIETATWIRERR